ncbi:MAG: tetratricopeptide repeat protein [Deltaproteobacteria bacterium]|nr:tetratricopeptide repeat protein [Deltaproteobacteria bacterium]
MSQSDFVTRGQALVTSGQYQEAVKVCRLGLLGRPTTVDGRIVLGQALLALKRFDEVLAEMRVALELDHTSIAAQILKGEALLKKGDVPAAVEVFTRVRPLAPHDAHLTALLADAQRSAGRPAISASHPSVGFLGGTGEDSIYESTKHYPNHSAEEEDTQPKDEDEDGIEDTGGNFTRPTSIAAPGSKKRSGHQQAMGGPSAAELGVGDRSGTMEVDPENDGIELDDEQDFGSVAAPPKSRARPLQGASIEGARGSVKASTRAPGPKGARAAPAPSSNRPKQRVEVSSVELDNDDLVEIEDTPAPRPSRIGGTAVRNAVKMPSGPIDQQPFGQPSTAATRKTEQAEVPPLAQVLAHQPYQVQPLPHDPRLVRGINAALPTAAAQPMPGMPAHLQATLAPHLGGPASNNAARPTLALNPAQQQTAAAVDALFGGEQPSPAWAKATVAAGSPQSLGAGRAAAHEATAPAEGLDPRIQSAQSQPSGGAFTDVSISSTTGKPLKTGVRRARSRLAVFLWILVGAAVIGGGVFAGFQIRAMRLNKQIAAARTQAVDLAKADTWLGWSGARDRLGGIARASATVDNRAALARARGVLAYEFGDGVPETKALLDKIGTAGGLDTAIAQTYLALAQNDARAAKAAADRATALAANDATVLYVSGQAALLGGDYKTALANLKASHEREPRPLYAVGLARATRQTGEWDAALAAVDRALGAMPDHPAALIERAFLLVASGRISSGATITVEVRTQLVKLIAEGSKPLAEQPRGVSPLQVALANLALAQVDFALRDGPAALSAIVAAANVGVEEQRFAEEAIETLYTFNELARAKAVIIGALEDWPSSRRARISQARVMIALGNPAEALEILARNPDALLLPRGQVVRGQARYLTGDLPGARADFDAALKKLPQLEPALVGRAWIDLDEGDVDEARKKIEPKFNPTSATVPMITVFAAIQRMSPDPGGREKARFMLEKVVAGPLGVDVPRAQLELGRLYLELGDFRAARTAFAEATRNGNTQARLDHALLLIEDRDPSGGRATLDALLKDLGANATPRQLLEGARARLLDGDHPGAIALLDQAEKLPGVEKWRLDRERGRLALRRGDVATAVTALMAALENSDRDAETFLLAADVVSTDLKATTALAQRVKGLVNRLKDAPEALIVKGKLALATEELPVATEAYLAARKALEKATPRRLAQAYFGLGVAAYMKGDDPNAKAQFELVMQSDPSIYAAYVYAADVLRAKPTEAFVLAQKSVRFNPDYVPGWSAVGQLAARLGKTKELTEAIARLTALAPNSDELKALQAPR